MARTRILSALSLVALACSVLFTAGCVPGIRESTVGPPAVDPRFRGSPG